jgi:hypothetical protein
MRIRFEHVVSGGRCAKKSPRGRVRHVNSVERVTFLSRHLSKMSTAWTASDIVRKEVVSEIQSTGKCSVAHAFRAAHSSGKWSIARLDEDDKELDLKKRHHVLREKDQTRGKVNCELPEYLASKVMFQTIRKPQTHTDSLDFAVCCGSVCDLFLHKLHVGIEMVTE